MPTHPEMNRGLRFCILVALFWSWTTTPPMSAQAVSDAHTPSRPATCVKWGDIPLSFEPNVGQESPEVRYLARGSSYTLYLASAEIVLTGHNQDPLRMTLSGANVAPRIVGEHQQVSTSNYLVGNDPAKWRTSVPNFGRTRYQGVYPGIDLVYYGHDGSLEYDWIVSPSADPRRIRLRFDSADRVRVDKQGDLVIEEGKTEYRHKKPVVYQDVAGRRVEVAGAWSTHGNEAGFRIGRYDRRQPLVIDPVLYYSTYLGGSGLDAAYAIAVDRVGNTYVTGDTASANFTTANPLQASLRGSQDVFVTKINASGSARLYSTYLGSTGVDNGRGIAVNSRGEVYVTGSAGFSDFPLKNPIQGTWAGSGDAFLTRLNATGSALVYSTYLGGSGIDQANGIALDAGGNAYVVGTTNSTNFPTVNAFQAGKGAQDDAFVAKINPAGSAWVYATYLGGNNEDQGNGIAVDASGNAYVTGYTQSTNFPVQSPYRGLNTGVVDAFVTKLNPVGSALVYSTYLGGSALDYGTAIAVDSSGSAYVTGIVTSDDFPLANPIDATLGSHAVDDIFVTKFNPAGSALMYSTYLGGGSTDDPYAIAVDKAGNAYVTGRTNSSDFPLVNPIQITRVAFDMFVTEINATGSAVAFSTFLGGSGSESGRGIAVDALGNIHIAGESTSTDFPALNAVQMTSGGGGQDGIVLLFATRLPYLFNDFTGKGCSDGEVIYDAPSGQAVTALSNGDGTYSYTPNTVASGFNVVRTGDFTGDGKADLILYNSTTAAASIGSGNGNGTFTFKSLFWSPGYDFVETGDLDGDAKTDVVLYNSQTGTMYAGISKGDGTFTYTYTLLSTGFTYVRLADFTGDGNADLFLYRGGDGVSFLGVGNGAGGFTFNALSLASGYNLADAGDLNGDGEPDLILYSSRTGQAATGISNGAGGFAFTPVALSPGFTSVRLADYTGDGLADVTVYNKNTAVAYLGIGTGTGAFNFQTLFWSPGYDYVISEDVNCDGKVDVILYNSTTGTEYTGISSGTGLFSYTYSNWGVGRVVADQNETLPVDSSITVSSFVLKPATVTGGQMVQGVVTLTSAATAPFAVSLSSANPAVAFVPSTVTVPAGSTSAEFTVRTNTVTVATTVNITATAFVAVTQPLNVTTQPATGAAPFGRVDTPADGATVTGSTAVTGWTLDDFGVTVVNIYRNCITGVDAAVNCTIVGGTNVVFIGTASFVAGARPDVEALYPMYPNSVRAGWGYLLLTNMLPHITSPIGPAGGQGAITIYAFATDLEQHQTLLGQKSMILDNDHAVTPFGAIDTPTQGGAASGILQNYGWALTPGSAMIPISGATTSVVVDGVALGTVTYNLCRDGASPPAGPGQCHDDIATLFPHTTNITNGSGAIGVFNLDTTKLTDGVHTIAWGVTDNLGRTEGIGSRFFTVQNGSGLIATESASSSAVTTSGGTHAQAFVRSMSTASTTDAAPAQAVGSSMDIAWLPPSGNAVTGHAGFNFNTPNDVIEADASGVRSLRVPELGRIELQLGAGTSAGYLNANGTLRPLPPGSQLNAATGQFTWVPGPGYVGRYDLVFVQGSSQLPVEVTIEPKSTIAAGLMRGWIDTPSSSSSVNPSFKVAGWALDTAAWHGAGVGAVHVWAQRRDVLGAGPVFLGSASLGGSRPDVAAAFGKQFDRTGWSLSASGLPAGVYEVTASFWSNRTEQFEDARTVTVAVR